MGSRFLQIDHNMHVTLGCNSISFNLFHHQTSPPNICVCVRTCMVGYLQTHLYPSYILPLSLSPSCKPIGSNEYIACTKTVSNFEKLLRLNKKKKEGTYKTIIHKYSLESWFDLCLHYVWYHKINFISNQRAGDLKRKKKTTFRIQFMKNIRCE